MQREEFFKGKEMILSAIFTGFSALQIIQSLKSFLGKTSTLNMLFHFAYTDPQNCNLSWARAYALLLFAGNSWGVAAAGVVARAVSPGLCLVGIVIHLMFCACTIAGWLLATRLDIMNSVSRFSHKSRRQSFMYPPQNSFYKEELSFMVPISTTCLCLKICSKASTVHFQS